MLARAGFLGSLSADEVQGTCEDRRVSWHEQLLACLTRNGRVQRLQDEVAKGDRHLSGHVPHNLVQPVRFHLPLLGPRSEVARLSIQSIASKRLLGSDGVHLPVGTQHTAVVVDVLVPDPGAEIDEHVFAHRVGDDIGQDLPAVQLRVIL